MRDNGVKIFEVEFLTDWFTDGDRRRQSDLIRRELLLAAEKTGARHIKIGGDMEGKSWPIGQVIQSFAGLCDEAKNAGTNVVLEILPWSNIPDIKTGIEVVSGADKSNGGLLVDIWHMGRGGIPYHEVAVHAASLSRPRRTVGCGAETDRKADRRYSESPQALRRGKLRCSRLPSINKSDGLRRAVRNRNHFR